MKYLFILLFLVGCGSTPSTRLVPTPVPVECESFGHIAGIKTLPVKFVKGVDEQGNQLLGLRGSPYSNLAINSKETIRYITEQNKAIKYYVKCIDDHNQSIEEGEQ